jgi:hypothetical protein
MLIFLKRERTGNKQQSIGSDATERVRHMIYLIYMACNAFDFCKNFLEHTKHIVGGVEMSHHRFIHFS